MMMIVMIKCIFLFSSSDFNPDDDQNDDLIRSKSAAPLELNEKLILQP